MELNNEIKDKLTERFLKRMGEPTTPIIRSVYFDLLDGYHIVNVSTRGKFTMVEIKYSKNGYEHHFLGISAKNPKDELDVARGVKVAFEDAMIKLFTKFYLDEYRRTN